MVITPTADQERWGTAITLLSLDRVMPFYFYMGLTFSDPVRFKELLRNCIIENRNIFERNPSEIPDLKSLIIKNIEREYSVAYANDFADWIYNRFSFISTDFAAYFLWYYLFGLSRNDAERWKKFDFSPQFSKEALIECNKTFDRNDLHSLADTIEKEPLSAWDLDMFTLHGFDEDDNDPYNKVLEIVKKVRFSAFFEWLLGNMNDAEKDHFLNQSRRLQKSIDALKELPVVDLPG